MSAFGGKADIGVTRGNHRKVRLQFPGKAEHVTSPALGHSVSRECPLLAQSGHSATEFQCPLLGVKRTWPFADVRFCGRYWG